MIIIKKDLGRDIESLEIVPIADIHLGDSNCCLDDVKEKIEYIKNNKNVYCILNGDLINNATKYSISDCYAEKLKPMEQIEQIFNLLNPIKDKILIITNGNHEFRTWKDNGIDLTKIIATQLGIEDCYTDTSALLFLRFGHINGLKETNGSNKDRELCYTIFVNHGSGGGRKEGAKAIRLADMSSIIDADIYIHSHTHLPMIFKEAYYRIDVRNDAVAKVDKLFVNTSSFLDYGGYGESKEMKPNSIDTPHIYLCGVNKKKFTAKL